MNKTPYSAFVTIRKKFVRPREDQEALDVTPDVDDISVNDIVLPQENLGLKQKCRDLTSDKGHLKLGIEELELKVEALVKENNILEEKVSQLECDKGRAQIRIEVTKGQLSNQIDQFIKERD